MCDWYAISHINKTFRCALAGQPLRVQLPSFLGEDQEGGLQHTQLHLVEISCCRGDNRASRAILERPFRHVLSLSHDIHLTTA